MKYLRHIAISASFSSLLLVAGCTNALGYTLFVKPTNSTATLAPPAGITQVVAIVRRICRKDNLREVVPGSADYRSEDKTVVAAFRRTATAGFLVKYPCVVWVAVGKDKDGAGVYVSCNDSTNNGAETTNDLRAELKRELRRAFGGKSVKSKIFRYYVSDF